MMLFLICILSLASFSACINHGDTNLQGNINQSVKTMKINGSAQLSNQSCENLKVNGSAHLDNFTVTGHAQVNGSAHISESSFGALKINGSAHLKKGSVKGQFTANGSVYITSSQLSNVTLSGTTFEIADTIISENIVVSKPGWFSSQNQSLELTNTIIEGDVTFDSGTGVIYLKGNSVIKGKVIGATVK